MVAWIDGVMGRRQTARAGVLIALFGALAAAAGASTWVALIWAGGGVAAIGIAIIAWAFLHRERPDLPLADD